MEINIIKRIFEEELKCIRDPTTQKLAIMLLQKAPEEFWTAPSSSSGKYHYRDEHGLGGCVLHTKRVFVWTLYLCHIHAIVGAARDALLSAALIHDVGKLWDYSGRSKDHILMVIEHYQKVIDQSMQGEIVAILRLVETHYGRWSSKTENLPVTLHEQILHLADMLSITPWLEGSQPVLAELSINLQEKLMMGRS